MKELLILVRNRLEDRSGVYEEDDKEDRDTMALIEEVDNFLWEYELQEVRGF
jgi:hypothetical protein